MRVLLIRPSSDMEQIVPPLGIVSLGSYLGQVLPDIRVRLLDNLLKNLSTRSIVRVVQDWKPDLIGISATYFESPDALRLCRALRPHTGTLVLGGPYPSTEYERLLQQTEVDACIVGEGEETLASMLRTLDAGKREAWAELPGVAVRVRDRILFSGRGAVSDLDSLPVPDFSLLPLERYFQRRLGNVQGAIQLSGRALPLATSRGCPFRCTYCSRPHGKRYRARSAARVVEDILTLADRYGVTEFHIVDDMFNLDSRRVMELSRLLVRKNRTFNFCFSNGLHAHNLSEELIASLRAMGTYRITIGIESVVPKVLESIEKDLDISHVNDVIEKLVQHRIITGGFFMLGLPGEEREDFHRTVDFAVNSRLHTATFHICQLFPGTPASERYVAEEGVYDSRLLEGNDYGRCTFNPSRISDEELLPLRRWAYRRFYLNPGRMVRLMRMIPRKRSLLVPSYQIVRYVSGLGELYSRRRGWS